MITNYINPQIIKYAIWPFIASWLLLALGIFVLSKNPKSSLNRSFFYMMIAFFVWLFHFSIANIIRNADNAWLFIRMVYTGVAFIPSTIFLFTLEFLEIRKSFYKNLPILISLFFVTALWSTDTLIAGTLHYPWGYFGKAGWMHHVFLGYFFLVAAFQVILLHLAYRKSKLSFPKKANQIKYYYLGLVVAYFASMDFIPTYGIKVQTFGYVFMMAFALITSYAIIRHHLMDIHLVIRRGIIYTFSLFIISLVFGLFLLLAQQISHIYFSDRSLLMYILVIFIASICYLPIFNLLLQKISVLLFKSSPEKLLVTNELMQKEIEYQNKLKMTSILAASMAHEIKNPLTCIKTFSEHIRDKYDDPQFRESFLRIIPNEVDRISGILAQLLNFSKPTPPSFVRSDITQIMDQTLSMLHNEFSVKSLKITKQYSNLIPQINLDPHKIKQAFINLLINAINHTPKNGSIEIRIKNSNVGCIKVSIKDTGCGISKENLKQIFEPFFTTRTEEGTGLGLSIVQQIVQEHKGRVEVLSAMKAGSEFMIYLPKEMRSNL